MVYRCEAFELGEEPWSRRETFSTTSGPEGA
jgi:hypothetical protein